MAKTYTLSEAVEIIAVGDDFEALADIGKRYPLLMHFVTKATAGGNGAAVVDLLRYIPDYVSANKVHSAMKRALLVDNDEGGTETPTAKKQAVKTDEEAPQTKKRGRGRPRKNPEPEPLPDFEDEDEDDENEDDGDYTGKTAVQLFKICKNRGIKAQPKKPAKYYIDLLKKADAAESEDEDEDDDWDI